MHCSVLTLKPIRERANYKIRAAVVYKLGDTLATRGRLEQAVTVFDQCLRLLERSEAHNYKVC